MKCSNMSRAGSWEVRLVRLKGFSDLKQISEINFVKCRPWLVTVGFDLPEPCGSSGFLKGGITQNQNF